MSSSNNSSVASYLIPAAIVGIAVVIKDVWVDGYSLSDEIVLADIGSVPI